MARRRGTSSAVAASPSSVTATGYKLDIRRRIDGLVLTFDFVVQQGDEQFTLRIDTLDVDSATDTALVQSLLRRIADLWPAVDLKVQVAGGHIVAVG